MRRGNIGEYVRATEYVLAAAPGCVTPKALSGEHRASSATKVGEQPRPGTGDGGVDDVFCHRAGATTIINTDTKHQYLHQHMHKQWHWTS